MVLKTILNGFSLSQTSLLSGFPNVVDGDEAVKLAFENTIDSAC